MRLAATLILLGAMVALLLSKVTSGGESRRGSSPASMSAASASTPAPIPLPAEFMGKWHPVVGSSYLARMRQEYSQSRLPGTPSFDKLVPQLKASQAAIWDFSQTEIIASFGGDEERRQFRVSTAHDAEATLELVTTARPLEIRLRLVGQDALELSFPRTNAVPALRMERVRP